MADNTVPTAKTAMARVFEIARLVLQFVVEMVVVCAKKAWQFVAFGVLLARAGWDYAHYLIARQRLGKKVYASDSGPADDRRIADSLERELAEAQSGKRSTWRLALRKRRIAIGLADWALTASSSPITGREWQEAVDARDRVKAGRKRAIDAVAGLLPSDKSEALRLAVGCTLVLTVGYAALAIGRSSREESGRQAALVSPTAKANQVAVDHAIGSKLDLPRKEGDSSSQTKTPTPPSGSRDKAEGQRPSRDEAGSRLHDILLPQLSDKDTGQVHFVTTPKIPLRDKLSLAIVAGYVTAETAKPGERGRLIAAVYVYNLGERGLLNNRMTLGLTFNELRLRVPNPRLAVEQTSAFDGVVETLEFAQLEPLLVVPLLENVRDVRVDLDVVSTRVPDLYVEMLRGLPARLRDVARTHGFSPIGSSVKRVGNGRVKSPPPPATAPFDAAQAKTHQQNWASYLDIPVETINSIGMKLTLIPPSEFLAGSPDSEAHRKKHETQHRVRITKPYYIGVFEVTQGEYQRVMGANPSACSQTGALSDLLTSREDTSRFAVENVSWEQATEFCQRLSALPEETSSHRVYRLPTEAEWENACRAGTATPFYFGSQLSGDDANYDRDGVFSENARASGEMTRNLPKSVRLPRVGTCKPNVYGLYDMHGNVNEWCLDLFGGHTALAVDDPSGPSTGPGHVIRGGTWMSGQGECRSAWRSAVALGERQVGMLGFRVVCDNGWSQ